MHRCYNTPCIYDTSYGRIHVTLLMAFQCKFDTQNENVLVLGLIWFRFGHLNVTPVLACSLSTLSFTAEWNKKNWFLVVSSSSFFSCFILFQLLSWVQWMIEWMNEWKKVKKRKKKTWLYCHPNWPRKRKRPNV